MRLLESQNRSTQLIEDKSKLSPFDQQIVEFFTSVLFPSIYATDRTKNEDVPIKEFLLAWNRRNEALLGTKEISLQDLYTFLDAHIMHKYDPGSLNPETMVRAARLIADLL